MLQGEGQRQCPRRQGLLQRGSARDGKDSSCCGSVPRAIAPSAQQALVTRAATSSKQGSTQPAADDRTATNAVDGRDFSPATPRAQHCATTPIKFNDESPAPSNFHIYKKNMAHIMSFGRSMQCSARGKFARAETKCHVCD